MCAEHWIRRFSIESERIYKTVIISAAMPWNALYNINIMCPRIRMRVDGLFSEIVFFQHFLNANKIITRFANKIRINYVFQYKMRRYIRIPIMYLSGIRTIGLRYWLPRELRSKYHITKNLLFTASPSSGLYALTCLVHNMYPVQYTPSGSQ